MKWLYIGQYSEGTTSRMRAEKLRTILHGWRNDVIDIHEPFYRTHRLFRSWGFRFKRGPLIEKVNRYILSNLSNSIYELIWIDKGVFIRRSTTEKLKQKARRLVHYTPDAAFFDNRSRHFERSLPLYDFVVTTKTFEWEIYREKLAADRLLFSTQGYDKNIHRPMHRFAEKEDGVAFVGRHEKSREKLVRSLLDRQIKVKLAGPGWKRFASAHSNRNPLEYHGEFLSGDDYAALISSCRFGLGCLSKRFEERHTTRTFEIPACGTALLTERNPEIARFFSENEIIYYADPCQLIETIEFYNDHPDQLEGLTQKGRLKVRSGGFEYQRILEKIVEQILSSGSGGFAAAGGRGDVAGYYADP